MAQVALLLQDEDFTRNTIFGGNIDVDKYRVSIKEAQIRFIKKDLGKELYSKIYTDYITNGGVIPAGAYKDIYDDYIFYMLIAKADELYSQVGAYTADNKGITKISSDNTQSINKEEIDSLANQARRRYDDFKDDFIEYMSCGNNDIINSIPEWKQTSCSNGRHRVIGGVVFRKNNTYRYGRDYNGKNYGNLY